MRIKLGTRGSALALAQAEEAARAFRLHGYEPEIVVVQTRGDADTHSPLSAIGHGAFTEIFSEMIARGALDIAVHSAKDLPVGVAWDNFFCLPRADARDVLLAVRGRGVQTIGTGSPRRAAAMARVCPGATVLPVRGNVDTRIRKMLRGEYDALVLAAAGLQRLGFYDERIAVRPLSVEECVPAACQGIIAIEGAVGAIIDDAPTARAARIERTCQRALEGDCTGGVGVYFDGETLYAQREGVIASVRYANENSIGDLIFRLGKRRET